MKLWVTRSMLMGAVALSVTAGLAGWEREAETATPTVEANKKSAEMRTEVPLTRPIALDKAGEVVNVEFDLPPPGRNASPMLMLGFRTESPDSAAAIALTSQLLEADLAAKVRLLRVNEGSIATVPLSRPTGEPGEWAALPPDGSVPGVTVTSLDTSLLEEAALLHSANVETYFKFAAAEKIEPRHYRLTVELMGDHPDFLGWKAELLLAYFKRGK
ncbi:hypothetical protein ACIGHF_15990 [Stenotrophomonas sp. NPDC077464]|uniref:hypothetical protein n=1 Tax=unclassified Stenotrophomonas TaxID=196198 RepID=UPI0037D51048